MDLGLSQAELGSLTGIDQSRISRIEKNLASLDITELYQLIRVLDIEICDIIPCGYNQHEREFLRSLRKLSKDYYRHFSTIKHH